MAPFRGSRRSADGDDPAELANQALADAARGDHRLARQKLARAARTGDADALFHIGQTYRLSLNDPPAAMGCYQRAADLGSTRGMAELGSLHVDQRDWTQAEYWLRRALTEGEEREFVVAYARVLMELDRRAEAREWCQHAADAGDGIAAAMLRLLVDEPEPATPPAGDQPELRAEYAMRLTEFSIMGVLTILFDQYRSTRDALPLEVAVAKGREFLDSSAPSTNPSMEFCKLWRRLVRAGYVESGSDDELFPELVRAERMRVAAAVPEDPDCPVYLAELAETLLASPAEADDPAALDEAVELLRRSLAQLPAEHPERHDTQTLLLGTALPAAALARAEAAGRRGRLTEARAALAELNDAIEQALRQPADQPELTEELTLQRQAGQAAAKLLDDALLRNADPATVGGAGPSAAGQRVATATWYLAMGQLEQAVAAIEPITAASEPQSAGAPPDGLVAHAHWLHTMILMNAGEAAAAGDHARMALRYAQRLLTGAEPLAEPAIGAAAWLVADLSVLPTVGLPPAERVALVDLAINACDTRGGRPVRLARTALLQQKTALLLDAIGGTPDPTGHSTYQEVTALAAELLAIRYELAGADPDRQVELVTAQLLAARVAAMDPGDRDRAVELVSQAWRTIQTLTWRGDAFRRQALAVARTLAPLAPDAVRRAQAANRWPT